jgi:hypothetical protein
MQEPEALRLYDGEESAIERTKALRAAGLDW